MKNFIEAAQYAFAALGGALGAVMGGFDGFLYALVVFVVVDYATGLMSAAVEKKLSNEGISILENAARIGLPIPEKLKAVLEQLREEKGE